MRKESMPGGSPLLEPFRRRGAPAGSLSSSISPLFAGDRRVLPESPLLKAEPRVLAPLFTNAATGDNVSDGSGISPAGKHNEEDRHARGSQNMYPDADIAHNMYHRGLSPGIPDSKEPSPGTREFSPVSRNAKGSPVLQLVPKDVAKLAALGKAGKAFINMVDPQPHWTLEDLRTELNALGEKLNASRLHEDDRLDADKLNAARFHEDSPKQGWSWREEVADFNRQSKPFIMRAYDDDDSDDEDSQDSQDSGESLEIKDEVYNEARGSESNSLASTAAESDSSRFLVRETHKPFKAEHILLPRTGKVEAALFEANRLRLLRVQEEMRQRKSQLEAALIEETQRSAAKLAQVMKEEEAKCEMTRRSDKQYQRSVAEHRDKYLSALQRDHEQRSQIEERKIRKEEEARRREIAAREEMELQMKAKAEAEAKQAAAEQAAAEKAAAEKVAEAERKQRAEAAAAAAAQRAEAERKEVEHKTREIASQKSSQGPKARVSVSAAEAELGRKKIFEALDQASQSLLNNPASRKNLKALEYQIAKIVIQISATEDQVRKKSTQLMQLLSDQQNQPFIVLTLASKLLSQCETQVLKVPSFAFACAQIVVNVATQVPFVMDAVLAKLNSACIFTVPKYFMYYKNDFENEKEYKRILGYREEDGKFETADDYIARMTAYVMFYGAITQTGGTNSHGISNGWRWCAELLNHLPANRYTASALYAYLETAGFRLYQTYPGPFMKLMQTVVTKFAPALQKQNDPDSRAILNRLETYLYTKLFMKEPEGRLAHEPYSTVVLRES